MEQFRSLQLWRVLIVTLVCNTFRTNCLCSIQLVEHVVRGPFIGQLRYECVETFMALSVFICRFEGGSEVDDLFTCENGTPVLPFTKQTRLWAFVPVLVRGVERVTIQTFVRVVADWVSLTRASASRVSPAFPPFVHRHSHDTTVVTEVMSKRCLSYFFSFH